MSLLSSLMKAFSNMPEDDTEANSATVALEGDNVPDDLVYYSDYFCYLKRDLQKPFYYYLFDY